MLDIPGEIVSKAEYVLISVVVCTYNRVDVLPRCLGSLLSQTLEKDLYEIIVVDNASSDGTKQTLFRDFADQPNLSYIYEATPGLSHARNTGYKRARGNYVAYIDDDATADPEWLKNILWVFENVQPRPAGVGGPVRMMPGEELPKWLPEEGGYGWLLSLYEKPTSILAETRGVSGTNMAFAKAVLDERGGFNAFLGRSQKNLIGGEEDELSEDIRRKGGKLYYQPSAVVYHSIPPQRKTRGWALRRFFYEGVSRGIIDLRCDHARDYRALFLKIFRRFSGFVIHVLQAALSMGEPGQLMFFGKALSDAGWCLYAFLIFCKGVARRIFQYSDRARSYFSYLYITLGIRFSKRRRNDGKKLAESRRKIRMVISAHFFGGIGGAERLLKEIVELFSEDEVYIFAERIINKGYIPRFGNYCLNRPLDKSKEYDIYVYMNAGSPRCLVQSARFKKTIIISNGGNIYSKEHLFDCIVNEGGGGDGLYASLDKARLMLPPVRVPDPRHLKKVKGLPKKFFLTVFNSYNNYFKGTDILYRLARHSCLPIVWCADSTSMASSNLGLGKMPSNVLLLKKLSFSEIYYLYQIAEAYISFSRSEGFGYSVADAVMFDLPIVSRDTGVVRCMKNQKGIFIYQNEEELIKIMERGIFVKPRYDRSFFEHHSYKNQIEQLLSKGYAG